MTGPELTVVVVSHNHARFLPACLSSLQAEGKSLPLEVVLVDNRSDDGSADVARAYPGITVILNRDRRGFAANNNEAVRRAAGRHILLLNPDTEVMPGALRALVRYLDEHPAVGIVGPQLLFPDGRVQPSCRPFPSLGWVLLRRTPLRFVVRDAAAVRRHLMEDVPRDAPMPVDWLLGAALAVRRELLQTVGLLDEGFFLYVEDIDWAWRARAGGFGVHYVPEARILHHHQAEIDRHLLSRRSWLHFRGMWRFWRKHLAPPPLRKHVTPETLPARPS